MFQFPAAQNGVGNIPLKLTHLVLIVYDSVMYDGEDNEIYR